MGGCSYIGIASRQPVARPLYDGLRKLQHRGQETAGIITFDGEKIYRDGGPGLVHEVFGSGGEDTHEELEYFAGEWGLGSTRYRTSGSDRSAPPFFIRNPCLIAGAFNGNIINYEELWSMLKDAGQYKGSDCDFEVLLNTFGHELSKVMRPTEPLRNAYIYTAAANVMDRVEGSYSAVFLVAKGKRLRLVGVCDPSANRPMVVGKAKEPENGWIIASEDCLFRDLGYEVVRYPEGGEVNIIDWKLQHRKKNLTNVAVERPTGWRNHGRVPERPFVVAKGGEGCCMFEWMYFARPDSRIKGRSVYGVRWRSGYKQGKRELYNVDIALPAPDSGRSANAGYIAGYNERVVDRFDGRVLDEQVKKELKEELIVNPDGTYKSPYPPRTFIMAERAERIANVDIKINPIPEAIDGLRIVYNDDSTVRLTTMSHTVGKFYDRGAKEVHVRITTPLIYSFCPLGIDMRSKNELAARTGFRNIREFLDIPSVKADVIDTLILAGSTEAAAAELGMDVDYLRRKLDEADARVIEDINKELGAASLDYCTIGELVEAINEVPVRNGGPESLPYERLCTGCLGGRYPIAKNTMEMLLKTDNGSGRAWEQPPKARKSA